MTKKRTKVTDEYKHSLVERMLGPEGISPNRLALETGISKTALWRWRKEASPVMTQDNSADLKPPAEKLRLILAADGLTGELLGSFLRAEGIHLADLDRWKAQILDTLAHTPARSKERNLQLKSLKRKTAVLEAELKRKDEALAETAALLVLSKKARRLWGGADELMIGNNDDSSSNS